LDILLYLSFRKRGIQLRQSRSRSVRNQDNNKGEGSQSHVRQEIFGNLAPASNLTIGTTSEGKPLEEIPYARLPRIERLKVSGEADTTEDKSEDEREVDGKKEYWIEQAVVTIWAKLEKQRRRDGKR